MPRLASSLSSLTAELVRWIDINKTTPLPAEMVPGASSEELQRLATLGAVAKALAPDALSGWPAALTLWANTPDTKLASGIASAAKEAIFAKEADLLAKVYEQLVSGPNRRRLGTFFTPPPIVTYMVDQAKDISHRQLASVIDPGAGVGAFTTAAHDAWPNARVLSVDLNVVTLGLLATRIAVEGRSQANKSQNAGVELIHGDYLSWLDTHWPQTTGPRLILGNPPYTRHQQMTEVGKAAARTAAGALITSGLAGLSAYFVAASLSKLQTNDSMVLLLPGSWLETRYGREIREWLWHSQRRRIELDSFPSQVEVFPGTQVTAMMLSVGPERRSKQPFIVRSVDLCNEGAAPTVRRRAEVRPLRNSSCPATFTRFLGNNKKPRQRNVLSLGSVATIRRGVATGRNSFFFLSDQTRAEKHLTTTALRPAIVKAAHCPGPILTMAAHEALRINGLPCWLLDLNSWNSAQAGALESYLDEGIKAEVHLTHLALKRREWHTVEYVKPPDIFLAPVGKKMHRIIVNEAQVVGSNNLYGIYLNDVAPWTARNLAAWLMGETGQASLRALAREYQGGSSKIEPKSLRTLEVPEELPSSDNNSWQFTASTD
ncbi:Eco57I restriction-modification methylase domain-containing protein [Micromonospora sp. NPDC005215]|uniref:Eco57I restriction-modification methylase domain-containing protein n=1 Tax=Micromonospora sp. NPDC005215 TaxID=3157024 RepID=UPI0033BF0F2C